MKNGGWWHLWKELCQSVRDKRRNGEKKIRDGEVEINVVKLGNDAGMIEI